MCFILANDSSFMDDGELAILAGNDYTQNETLM